MIPRGLDPWTGQRNHPALYSSVSLISLPFLSFDVVQSAVMDNYLSLHHVAPPPDHSRRFYSKQPSRLSSSRLARSFEGTSFMDDAGVEGYHRVLYHISYYNTACYNPCCRVSIGFCAFFPFLVQMRQPTMTDTCVFVFDHARSRGNPCVPTTCVRFFAHTFFSGSCTDRVSQKSGARIRSAIHDLHVSLVRTPPRGTGYIYIFFLIFLSACEGLCRRVSEMYLSDLATETGLGTSHLVELLGGQRVSRTVLQLGSA